MFFRAVMVSDDYSGYHGGLRFNSFSTRRWRGHRGGAKAGRSHHTFGRLLWRVLSLLDNGAVCGRPRGFHLGRPHLLHFLQRLELPRLLLHSQLGATDLLEEWTADIVTAIWIFSSFLLGRESLLLPLDGVHDNRPTQGPLRVSPGQVSGHCPRAVAAPQRGLSPDQS